MLRPLKIHPLDRNYSQKRDIRTKISNFRFGDYTVNPDTQSIDWEIIDPSRIVVLRLPEFIGRTMAEVVDHIIKTYGATHLFPGIELWHYISSEQYKKAPSALQDRIKEMRDGNAYFFLVQRFIVELVIQVSPMFYGILRLFYLHGSTSLTL